MRGSLKAVTAALAVCVTSAGGCGGVRVSSPQGSPAPGTPEPGVSGAPPANASIGTTVTSSADSFPEAAPETTSGGEAPELPASQADERTDPTPGEGVDHGALPTPSKYASLDRARCEAELTARHVPFERVGEARGVLAPLRLTGPVAGVTFHSPLPASKRHSATMEIYDCRLVLALDDFAHLLARHGIVEVVHLSVYRPVPAKALKAGALGRRHGGALAIDAAVFKTKDGQTFSVEKDFGPRRIGARPCPAPANATELRKIACEANDARLFNVLLTPDYNWAHRNHFHLEVTAGVRWTLVR
jgi:hypothetical protein